MAKVLRLRIEVLGELLNQRGEDVQDDNLYDSVENRCCYMNLLYLVPKQLKN